MLAMSRTVKIVLGVAGVLAVLAGVQIVGYNAASPGTLDRSPATTVSSPQQP